MKARIEVGTDIAMLGAWDWTRNDSPLSKFRGKEFKQAIEADSRAGHLFLICTGADCGGHLPLSTAEDFYYRRIARRLDRPGGHPFGTSEEGTELKFTSYNQQT